MAHAYPPFLGGLSYPASNLSEALYQLGREVEVLTLDPSGRLPKLELRDGVTAREPRMPR